MLAAVVADLILGGPAVFSSLSSQPVQLTAQLGRLVVELAKIFETVRVESGSLRRSRCDHSTEAVQQVADGGSEIRLDRARGSVRYIAVMSQPIGELPDNAREGFGGVGLDGGPQIIGVPLAVHAAQVSRMGKCGKALRDTGSNRRPIVPSRLCRTPSWQA